MDTVLHRWMKIVSRNPLATHLFFMCFAITLGVFFYFWQGISTQNALAEQMLHRQQVVARSGAMHTGDFLADFGRIVALYTTRDSFTSWNLEAADQDLQLFKTQWANTPVEGAILIDSSGTLVASSNRIVDPKNPVNLSDRSYFEWAKTRGMRGEYYVGSPIISRVGSLAGKYVVPVASPVFDKKGNFQGVLAGAISVDRLVTELAGPLKISDQTMIFVVDDSAKFIFSSIPSLDGKTITSVFEGVNFPGKDEVVDMMYKHLPNGTEGKLDITVPNITHGGKLTRYLVSYTKIQSNQNKWSFAIVTPANEAFLFSGPFYADQIGSLIYLIVVVVSFSIVGITSARLRR